MPMLTAGSMSMSMCQPGDIPSSPTRGPCSMATISSTGNLRREWLPWCSLAQTPSRPGMISRIIFRTWEGNSLRLVLKNIRESVLISTICRIFATKYGNDMKTAPKDWFEAFSRLDRLLSKDSVRRSPNGKKIVFLDEFPWFATKRSDFLVSFEDFWNRRGTLDGDLVFIICGSATSWIIKNVIKDTGNMFQRVTKKIRIEPFTLAETEAFFKDREFDWPREQIAECQMIFGGLPFFFDLMNTSLSLPQNMNRLLFNKDALYRDETRMLLEATLNESPVYGQILSKLAFAKYGIKKSKLQEDIGASNGTYGRAIQDLVDCGYIIEYKKKYEEYKPLYIQLMDPFLLFHYHYLSKERQIDSYENLVSDTGRYDNWRGQAFEILCFNNTRSIKMALGISGVKTEVYP